MADPVEQAEPVGYLDLFRAFYVESLPSDPGMANRYVPVYTAPPKPETDNGINERLVGLDDGSRRDLGHANSVDVAPSVETGGAREQLQLEQDIALGLVIAAATPDGHAPSEDNPVYYKAWARLTNAVTIALASQPAATRGEEK